MNGFLIGAALCSIRCPVIFSVIVLFSQSCTEPENEGLHFWYNL